MNHISKHYIKWRSKTTIILIIWKFDNNLAQPVTLAFCPALVPHCLRLLTLHSWPIPPLSCSSLRVFWSSVKNRLLYYHGYTKISLTVSVHYPQSSITLICTHTHAHRGYLMFFHGFSIDNVFYTVQTIYYIPLL